MMRNSMIESRRVKIKILVLCWIDKMSYPKMQGEETNGNRQFEKF